MRKPKYITRRVNATICNCMVANTDGEVFSKTVSFPRTFKSEKEMKKACMEAINNDSDIFVKVDSVEFTSGIYGISESVFMANAVKLADAR